LSKAGAPGDVIGPENESDIRRSIIAEGGSPETVTTPDLAAESAKIVAAFKDASDRNDIAGALAMTTRFVTICNQAIDFTEPWRKAKDPRHARALDGILYDLAESVRILAILISPVLPRAAAGILQQLNWTGPLALAEASWGKLPEGHQLGKPVPIFPRIEVHCKSGLV
jgi:methionyl-tRNA synthetase